jgi:hypothetical protein
MRPTAPQILEQNSHEARENASCFEQRLFLCCFSASVLAFLRLKLHLHAFQFLIAIYLRLSNDFVYVSRFGRSSYFKQPL